MENVNAYSESGRGGWHEGVSSLEPDGRCFPSDHGKVVLIEQEQQDSRHDCSERSWGGCHEYGQQSDHDASCAGTRTSPDCVFVGCDVYNGIMTGDVCATLTANSCASSTHAGPTVLKVVYPINLMVATRGGRDDMRTCFGIGEANEPQFTLSSAHMHGICYSIDALSSNSMKSDNPHSGFHETEIVKCLDTKCNNPSCNQGGNNLHVS